ncbi:uncharacterized protein N7496_012816 [Penicillium cataractarum]|uniref:Uncharacterized protein n=1 Tax=Penicillium cataractarum TaxID=2100454 RepID=A0A9W9UR27_9EURO|nr:uncharacterized protein N7496_012816 [Penicillium cataractarum]KAJ5354383.1 hypothetical protein N7496_012816 [Penicillium cataractarum]
MKNFALIFAFAASVVPALARPAVDDSDIKPPYPMGQVGWVGRLSKDGPTETIWADDLDDVDVIVQAKKPGFSIFDGSLDAFNNAIVSERSVTEGRLEKRERYCNNFGQVGATSVNDGIEHLRGVTAGCSVAARQCIRTTCNGGAAIVLCNDNYNAITIPCGTVATMAQDINRNCMWAPSASCTLFGCNASVYVVSGQEFADTGGYNVIVGTCGAFSASGQSV